MRAVLVPPPLPASGPLQSPNRSLHHFCPNLGPLDMLPPQRGLPQSQTAHQSTRFHALQLALPPHALKSFLHPFVYLSPGQSVRPCRQDLVHVLWAAASPFFSLAGGLLGLCFSPPSMIPGARAVDSGFEVTLRSLASLPQPLVSELSLPAGRVWLTSFCSLCPSRYYPLASVYNRNLPRWLFYLRLFKGHLKKLPAAG